MIEKSRFDVDVSMTSVLFQRYVFLMSTVFPIAVRRRNRLGYFSFSFRRSLLVLIRLGVGYVAFRISLILQKNIANASHKRSDS